MKADDPYANVPEMASFGAVCVDGPRGRDFERRAAAIGIARLRDALPEERLWIDTAAGLSFYERSMEVAKAVSAFPSFDGTTYALVGQSAVDAYAVAEFERGRLLRELMFNRDDGGWLAPTGVARPWESDLHFALPLEGFIDELDEEWTDAEIANAKEAYERRELSALPRLPGASYRQLTAFAEKLGLNFEVGAHARYRKPGLFSRIFGTAKS